MLLFLWNSLSHILHLENSYSNSFLTAKLPLNFAGRIAHFFLCLCQHFANASVSACINSYHN